MKKREQMHEEERFHCKKKPFILEDSTKSMGERIHLMEINPANQPFAVRSD